MSLLGSVGSSRHTWNLTLAAGSLGVLTTNSVAPEVSDTSVDTDLLHSLNITTDSGNQTVDNQLSGLAGGEVLLSVNEPIWNLELLWVVDDGDQLFNFFVGKSTSTTVNVNFSLLADQVGEALADTNNLGHGEHNLALSIDVSVQHTKNVLKLISHLQTLLEIRRIIVNKKLNDWKSGWRDEVKVQEEIYILESWQKVGIHPIDHKAPLSYHGF
jgi:hypothetical protein